MSKAYKSNCSTFVITFYKKFKKNLKEVFNHLQCPPLFAVQLSLYSADHGNCHIEVYNSCQFYDKCIYWSRSLAVIPTWQLQEMHSSIGDGAIGSFEPTGSNDPL